MAEQKENAFLETEKLSKLMRKYAVPLLNVDVWEHAYYLKHDNMRSAYLDDWFRTVDYTIVERRYRQTFAG